MVPSPGMGLGRRGHLGQGGKDSDIVRVKHQALVVSHIVFISTQHHSHSNPLVSRPYAEGAPAPKEIFVSFVLIAISDPIQTVFGNPQNF